jgi:hypothetical protein
MLAFPGFLDTASNPCSAPFNSFGNIFYSITYWLSGLSCNTINRVANPSTCGSDDTSNCICDTAHAVSTGK